MRCETRSEAAGARSISNSGRGRGRWGRTRARALAPRGGPPLARPLTTVSRMEGGAISTTGRRSYHPAVQSIERRRPPRGADARVGEARRLLGLGEVGVDAVGLAGAEV